MDTIGTEPRVHYPETLGSNAVRNLIIASAVAIFFVLTSTCVVLSLSTVFSDDFQAYHLDAPQIAMICIMGVGVALMVAFLCVRENEDEGNNDKVHGRHVRRGRLSLKGIVLFYGLGCILDINHFIAELDCMDSWRGCENHYVRRYHIVNMVFHGGRLVFMGLETVVCLVVELSSLAGGVWMIFSVAVVQSANIALMFQSIVRETYAHEHDTSLEVYFMAISCYPPVEKNLVDLCDNVTACNNTTEFCWNADSSLLRWLTYSNPLLYPIAIEFSLLVLEVMLRQLFRRSSQNRDRDARNTEETVHLVETDDQQRLVDQSTRTTRRKNKLLYILHALCIAVAIVINMAFCVLTVLILLMARTNDKQKYEYIDIYTCYSVFHLSFLIVFSITGMVATPCHLFRAARVHNSILDYLLLFSAVGFCLTNIKSIVVSTEGTPIYTVEALVNIAQVILQVIFYYRAKDVLEDPNFTRQRTYERKVMIMGMVLTVLSLSNGILWLADSFFLSDVRAQELAGMGNWQTFDNIVAPLDIFFRFNSTLLFWCARPDMEKVKRTPGSRQETVGLPNYSDEDIFFDTETGVDDA